MERGGEGARREALLRLATEVAGLDADVADPLLQQRLTAVTDALAHALVDLADGAETPRVGTTWPARPTSRRPTRARLEDVDLGSCSAMAAAARRVVHHLDHDSAAGPGAARVARAADRLAVTLQDYVQEVGAWARVDDPLPATVTTRVTRQLRAVHELLSTDGLGGRGRTPAPRGTTVQP